MCVCGESERARERDDIMQRKVDNIFYVTEADNLPPPGKEERLVSRGRGRQLWANQRAEITHGLGKKRGVKRCPGSFQYMAVCVGVWCVKAIVC